MLFGDGLKDAIWRCDRILSGDGLRDAIWKLLVGGWAYRCHLKVIVSCWRWACRGHPRMFVELYVVGDYQKGIHVWNISELGI